MNKISRLVEIFYKKAEYAPMEGEDLTKHTVARNVKDSLDKFVKEMPENLRINYFGTDGKVEITITEVHLDGSYVDVYTNPVVPQGKRSELEGLFNDKTVPEYGVSTIITDESLYPR